MTSRSSRVRPFPWDCRVWSTPPDASPPSLSAVPSTGLMFVPQQNGMLVGKKQTIVETIYPIAQEYDSAPVYKERTFVFKPNAGMGERQQSSTNDMRYHYALDCWIIGGLFGKGPLLHEVMPPTTGSVVQFIDGLSPDRSKVVLYILAGNYVLSRNDDTNAGHAVNQNGGAATAQSAVRFEALGTSPIDAVYTAWSSGVLVQHGPTNVQCALPTGMLAHYVEKIGRELWIADATHSVIRSTTNDPTQAGSWSGPIQIGDSSVPITCLRAAGGKLWILKSNGDVFSVNADGSDNDWFPSQAEPLDPTNGRTASSWLGSLWFRAGPTFYKMDPTPGLTPVGPERYLQNASEVQGPVQCFCGWGAHLAFGGIYNTNTAQTSTSQPTSYLMTYGNWEPGVQVSPQGPSLQFVDQWDGAVAHWPNRQITNVYVTSVTSPPRLYCGFADGGFDYFLLVQNPLALGTAAEYTTGPSRIVAPIFTDMFEANKKQFVAVSGFGPRLNAGDNLTVNYRVRGSTGSPGPMGDVAWHAVSPPITQNGQRVDFPGNVGGIACEIAVDLANTSSSETPVLEGLGFHARVVPDFRYDWTATIDAKDYVGRKDGASVRQSGRQIRDVLTNISGQPSLATVELPDETIEGLAFVQYQERWVPHSGQTARFGQQLEIDLQMTQFYTEATIGTVGRLRGNTIGSLHGFTIGSLRTM